MSPIVSAGTGVAGAAASSGTRRPTGVLIALACVAIVVGAGLLGFWLGFSQVTRLQLGGGILQSRLMACDGSVLLLQAVSSAKQLTQPAAAGSRAQACLNSLEVMMPYLAGPERLAAERQIAQLRSLLVSRALALQE